MSTKPRYKLLYAGNLNYSWIDPENDVIRSMSKAEFWASTVCASRGPRIGGEGVAYCAQARNHPGAHKGYPGSGFENEWWGDPEWRDQGFARDWTRGVLAHA